MSNYLDYICAFGCGFGTGYPEEHDFLREAIKLAGVPLLIGNKVCQSYNPEKHLVLATTAHLVVFKFTSAEPVEEENPRDNTPVYAPGELLMFPDGVEELHREWAERLLSLKRPGFLALQSGLDESESGNQEAQNQGAFPEAQFHEYRELLYKLTDLLHDASRGIVIGNHSELGTFIASHQTSARVDLGEVVRMIEVLLLGQRR
jgi:hypothetical protein